MADVTITTDRKWKHFKYDYEVPQRTLKREFDYLEGDQSFEPDGYFKYRRRWYHITEFMRMDNPTPAFEEWHAYLADSAFSGILIKLSKDGEQYQVATFIFVRIER